ncbi:MAG: fused MFS/spermidine synthase [Actinomycetota bacterium]|nr:fused MFS/spermidine synthase [Actinomycetota bacterium]MDQ3720601.1 fused MFS/spermidine synthase [Actinomycetota bacterium]
MPPLPLLVFVVGTGSLGAEIAAVRLLSPYFGASTVVWANTIGVVLVALSVGYWLGGRLADRHPHMRGLCLLALVAAGLLALVPFAADPLLGLAVDALDSISAGAFFGSLVAVLVLVAVPVLLLGAVSPYAIRLAVSSVEEAGTVAGRLYALSTAGSLVGTLLSALLLIPLIGTRRTFLVFALAIAVMAVLGLRPARRYALAPAAIAVLIVLPVGTLKAETNRGRVVYETDTEYQYARVVETSGGSRYLELNEGQAQHSIYHPESVLTDDVWDGHLVLPFAARDSAPRRVAILGNAAGTTSRAYERFFPGTRVDGVEIDPELSEIGRRYFDMTNPRLRLYHEDARPFLRRVDARYDVISVDAYRQPYIPFYLTTREFFETVRDRLAPDGVLVVNAGHPEGQDELEEVLTATMGDVFTHVMRDPIEPTNTLIVASRRPLSPGRIRAALPSLPPGLRRTASNAATRLAPPLKGGRVYTDDEAPVEWLIDKSIVDYASGGQ